MTTINVMALIRKADQIMIGDEVAIVRTLGPDYANLSIQLEEGLYANCLIEDHNVDFSIGEAHVKVVWEDPETEFNGKPATEEMTFYVVRALTINDL